MKSAPVLKGFYYPPAAEPEADFDELAAPAAPFVEIARLYLEAIVEPAAEQPIVLPGGELIYRSDFRPCHCGATLFDVVVVRRITKLGTLESASVQCPNYYTLDHRPDFRASEIIHRLGVVDLVSGVLTLNKEWQ